MRIRTQGIRSFSFLPHLFIIPYGDGLQDHNVLARSTALSPVFEGGSESSGSSLSSPDIYSGWRRLDFKVPVSYKQPYRIDEAEKLNERRRE
jgi:hypothetical protein